MSVLLKSGMTAPMSTHTPGPWDVSHVGHSNLLAALKTLQRQALQSPDLVKTEWGQEALEQARAAIAKAEGTV